MNLSLTNEEAALLLTRLKADLGNLKSEISNTDNYDWRVEMKKDEERLRDIISRLEQATAAV